MVCFLYMVVIRIGVGDIEYFVNDYCGGRISQFYQKQTPNISNCV